MCRIIKMLIETAQIYQTKPLLLFKSRPISVLTNACLHHRLLISGQKGGKQNGAVVPIKGLSQKPVGSKIFVIAFCNLTSKNT